MERNEISAHEVRVYHALRTATAWLSSADVARLAAVAGRTARAHCLKLVNLGLADQAEVFPSHRYRISDKAGKRNVAYLQRLERAGEALGIASGLSG